MLSKDESEEPIYELVLCGSAKHARTRMLEDFKKDRLFGYSEKARLTEIHRNADGHELIVMYCSIRAQYLDAYHFHRISVDSSALMNSEQIKILNNILPPLVDVRNALYGSQLAIIEDDTNA